MRTLIKGIVFLHLLSISYFANAQQEYVTGVTANTSLQDSKVKLKSTAIADTLELPFFDDFTNPSNKLNVNHWMDEQVNVNQSYARNPVSVGVATFDILNTAGRIYDSATVFPFVADQLTSKPINLEGKNNVFLSFFYQPKGLGDAPEMQDSLMLFFKSGANNLWKQVWTVPGMDYMEFEQVILPVSDEYLQSGFQFRFMNKGSLTKEPIPELKSNGDHWNLDYVYLDEGRSPADTSYQDIVFSQPPDNILENYTSLPWDHFPNARPTELKPRLYFHVKNLNSTEEPINVRYIVKDVLNPSHISVETYNLANLQAFEDTVFEQDLIFEFLESTATDSAIFMVEGNLFDFNEEKNRTYNDTVKKIVRFKDYYAYDDGTAEAGYGFRGTGSGVAQLAYRFFTHKTDSLRSIDIFFNPTHNFANNGEAFILTVWDYNDQTDLPGNIIYQESVFVNGITQGFINYDLNEPVLVRDNFFVGWQQVYENYLNIGYDRNSNNSNNTFINFNGFWQNSGENGTLMIRPVFGKRNLVTGVFPEVSHHFQDISVYPNPASNQLYIKGMNSAGDVNVQILDLTGKLVYNGVYNGGAINIEMLKEGIYFVKIRNASGNGRTQKIVINR